MFLLSFLLKYKIGDEVIEWNGRTLHGISTQDVSDIINDSKHQPQVELILSRIESLTRRSTPHWHQSNSPIRFHQTGIKKNIYGVRIGTSGCDFIKKKYLKLYGIRSLKALQFVKQKYKR